MGNGFFESPASFVERVQRFSVQEPGKMPAAPLNAEHIPFAGTYKDMAITLDGELRMAEVGEGNLNWKEILAAADQGGVEHLLVEQDAAYERDPFDSLAISYRFLKGMGYKQATTCYSSL